jgi:hypothetical protein
MYSNSNYSNNNYNDNSLYISQTTINIIIIIILLVIFFFLFNHCSTNYFTNLNSSSDNQIDDLKNELAFVKEELFNKKVDVEIEDKYIKIEDKSIKIEDKSIESQKKIYNTDFLLNGNININKSEPNLNSNYNSNYNNDVIIQPVAPPIIYDPIQNYDRLKLMYTLFDKRCII